MYPAQRQPGESGQGHYQPHPGSSPPQHPAHSQQQYAMPPLRQSLPPVDALAHSPQPSRGQPPSPGMSRSHMAPAPNSRSVNAYYDPTVDARHAQHPQGHPHQPSRSPTQVRGPLPDEQCISGETDLVPQQARHQLHGPPPIERRQELNGHHSHSAYANSNPPTTYHSHPPHGPAPSPYPSSLPPVMTSPAKSANVSRPSADLCFSLTWLSNHPQGSRIPCPCQIFLLTVGRLPHPLLSLCHRPR